MSTMLASVACVVACGVAYYLGKRQGRLDFARRVGRGMSQVAMADLDRGFAELDQAIDRERAQAKERMRTWN